MSGLRTSTLDTTPEACTNACDPLCKQYNDSPTDLTFSDDAGLKATDAGITVTGTGSTGSDTSSCTSAKLESSALTLLVQSLLPADIAALAKVQLGVKLLPDGCSKGNPPIIWVVDKPDLGTITGTGNGLANFTLAQITAGPIQIYAIVDGKVTPPITLNVLVNAVDNALGAPLAKIQQFLAQPLLPEANQILYPYPGTQFPLGLMPPVVQWTVQGGIETTKITLQSPPGTGTTFKYTTYLQEGLALPPESSLQRYNIPKDVWDSFTQSARGQLGEIVVQHTSDLITQFPRSVVFKILDGQIKGTIYYNSYNSAIAKAAAPATTSARGGVLAFRPGIDTQPKLAVKVGSTTTCIDCHTVSSDGRTLIAQEENAPGGSDYRRAYKWDLSSGVFPVTATTVAYPETSNGDGRKFVWGAQYPDGSFALSNVGDNVASNSYSNISPWTSPFLSSSFYPTTSATPSSLAVAGWPSTIQAVQPSFAHDGRAVAFTHFAGNNVGSTAARAGHALTVADFDCGAATGSTACTTAKNISGARLVYNDTSNTKLAGWSSFLPDRSGVVYQVTTRPPNPSGLTFNGTKVSDLATVFGAQAEIWMSPSAGPSTSAHRLDQLNGFKPTKSGSLGVTNGTTTFTDSSASFVTWNVQPGAWIKINTGLGTGQYYVASVTNQTTLVLSQPAFGGIGGYVIEVPTTTSGSTLTSYLPYTTYHWTGVNVSYTNAILSPFCNWYSTTAFAEEQLNYQPTMNPTASAGANWVVFTSRRRYGNVATGNPWEPELTTCGTPQPTAPAKQLWMASIDSTWAPGSDPSHPPIYLQGQELAAGNSRGFWAQTTCTQPGVEAANVCQTSDDCCTGSSCVIDSVSPVVKHCRSNSLPLCNPSGGACQTAADCCVSGSVCGGGTCSVPAPYTKATFTREYASACVPGELPVWHLFKWNATETAPSTSASIAFSVQSSDTAGTYADAAIALATADASNWNAAPAAKNVTDVDTVLKANALRSKKYLRVTMDLTPSATSAPVLQAWDQTYSCVPNE